MSTERPVLRPGGNVALLKKSPKPPPSPPKDVAPPPPLLLPQPKVTPSPPNSQPCTPKAGNSPVLKPNSARRCVPSCLTSPRKPPPLSYSEPGVASQKPKVPPHTAILARSKSEVIRRANASGTAGIVTPNRSVPPPTSNKLGSISLDETSLSHIVTAKKAAASAANAQRKLKVAEYGRKEGKSGRVVPDVALISPMPAEPKRCKFITPNTDRFVVAHHDEEWGVPCHNDRMLFELLVLAGLQAELSWATILHKRDTYRLIFCGFDAAAVASFTEKHIQALECDQTLLLPGGKIRGVVENARRILEVIEEHGSLDNYLWGFLSFKPMINHYCLPKQVPVKTSKSESISKDLVRRGFRFVGPTIMYSFMQATGMINDHLVQCFRHQECIKVASSQPETMQEQQQEPRCFNLYEGCEFYSLQLDGDQTLDAESIDYFNDLQLDSQGLEEGEHCCTSVCGEDDHGSMDDQGGC